MELFDEVDHLECKHGLNKHSYGPDNNSRNNKARDINTDDCQHHSGRDKAERLKQLSILGLTFLQNEDIHSASIKFKEMLSLKPNHAIALYGLGIVAYRQHDYENASELLGAALNSNITKKYIQSALFHYGCSLQAMKRNKDAIASYNMFLKLNPVNVACLNNLGLAYGSIELHNEAIKCYKKIIALAPNDSEAHTNLGNVFNTLKRVADAIACFKKAIAIQPNYISAYINLGLSYIALGKFDKAMTCCKRIMAIDPDCGSAYRMYVSCKLITTDDAELVARMEELSAREDLSQENRVEVLFALGKCKDDLKSYDEAFSIFSNANQLERHKHRFSQQECEDGIAALISVYSEEFLSDKRFSGVASDTTPIFIIGMPRTGTTLVEQILSSHPSVSSVGESVFWKQQICKMPYDDIAAIKPADINSIANRYLTHLRSYSNKSKHIIDKMPGNFLNLGLIHLCFPSARIIHCQRNPLDSCLSMYFHKFVGSNSYTYDFNDMVFFYEQYQKLMTHWKNVIPNKILEVQYEKVVANLGTETEIMLDFLDLEWDDKCLNYFQNDQAIFTASSWQVKQPIYTSSVGRWENYQKHIGQLERLHDPKYFQ